ncbi:MAG: hypothetical protein IKQ61_00300 [Spirochaetales bacterium]|nr:hypothetical protein [Spirochaetales bacterium]
MSLALGKTDENIKEGGLIVRPTSTVGYGAAVGTTMRPTARCPVGVTAGGFRLACSRE